MQELFAIVSMDGVDLIALSFVSFMFRCLISSRTQLVVLKDASMEIALLLSNANALTIQIRVLIVEDLVSFFRVSFYSSKIRAMWNSHVLEWWYLFKFNN